MTTRSSTTPPVAPNKSRQPRTRIRLSTGDGNGGTDEVAVSSNVAIAPVGGGGADGSSEDDDDVLDDGNGRGGGQGNGGNNDGGSNGGSDGGQPGDDEAHIAGVAAANRGQDDDDLESMDWWDALASGQQRSMMRRFMGRPAAPAPAQPILVDSLRRGAIEEQVIQIHRVIRFGIFPTQVSYIPHQILL
ncbi:hypothetical protein PInf_018978 [Phytophthora infestans]|nr:hypothetical protein PInf_018978 [Phytophthora infestans]